jgi:hypothetical protein
MAQEKLPPPYWKKRKHGTHATVIYERSALHQGVVLLGAALAKLEWFVNSQHKNIARLDDDCREAIGWHIERSHAIDPGIHVPAIEIWKSKLALKAS